MCASKDLSANSGYIQYRFGAKDKVEMALPERPSDFRSIAFAGHLMFSGGGAEYVRFTNAAYSYVVYDGMGRGWGSRSGVAVETKGKLAATFACKGQPTADNGLNYGDVWSKAGMRIDSDAVASDIWSTLSTW